MIMKLTTLKLLLALVSIGPVGCLSYTKKIGSIGCGTNEVVYYKLQLGSLVGESQTVIVMQRSDGTVEHPYPPIAGSGMMDTVPQAVGTGVGLSMIGYGIKHSRGDSTTVNSSSVVDSEVAPHINSQNFIGPRPGVPSPPPAPPRPGWPPGHHKPGR